MSLYAASGGGGSATEAEEGGGPARSLAPHPLAPGAGAAATELTIPLGNGNGLTSTGGSTPKFSDIQSHLQVSGGWRLPVGNSACLVIRWRRM